MLTCYAPGALATPLIGKIFTILANRKIFVNNFPPAAFL